MGMVKFEVSHSLSKEEARKRTEALLGYWGKKYGVKSTWNGDGANLEGKLMGMTLKASLSVGDARVGGEASDPGFLLREQARKYLTQKFNKYLDPKADLASLERGEND